VYKQVPIVQVVQSKLASSGGAAKSNVPCSGVLVDFGMGVRGFIPATQMFDAVASSSASSTGSSHFRAKLMQTMYAVGAKVNVRVLSVHDKRCMLTAKKAIVQAPEDQIITSYDGIKVGQRAVGFVTRIVEDKDGGGMYVTFCNNVYGRVTAKSLESELGVDRAQENYQLGDAVVCRVTSIQKRLKKSRHGKPAVARRASFDDEMDVDDDPAQETGSFFWELTLSMKLESSLTEGEVEDKTVPEASSQVLHLRAGSILPLRSLRVVDLINGRDKQGSGFVPGYAIVSIKTKYVVTEGDLSNLPEFIECKLPYDQLLDEYDASTIQSASALDQLAEKLLSPGKKVNRKGLVMTDPEKLLFEYTSGIGKLAVVSVRPRLIEVSETQSSEGNHEVVLPSLESQFFVGATLVGYIAQIDRRHGAFVRFLNGLTGLVPKSKGGLELGLFSTVTSKVVALDVAKRPMQILLSVVAGKQRSQNRAASSAELPLKIGDVLHEVEVSSVDFHRAEVKVLDENALQGKKYRARLHVSMAKCTSLREPLGKAPATASEQIVSEYHPFHGLIVGAKMTDLRVAAIDVRKNTVYLDLTSHDGVKGSDAPLFVESLTDLSPDQQLSGIVTSIDSHRSGLYVQISPSVTGFIPGLELSKDPDILNNLSKHFVVGSRLDCVYVNRETWRKRCDASHHKGKEAHVPFFSLLRLAEREDPGNTPTEKPAKGQLVVGRINRSLTQVLPPALMLELRFGYAGRCCVCELEEQDEWRNLPFGSWSPPQESKSATDHEQSR
jgi:ribosomal protein S1